MPKQVKVLRVVAKRDGFRRAGMELGAVPKNLPLEEIPKHVHTAITGDPSLVSFQVVMHQREDGTLVDIPQPDLDDTDSRKAELEKLAAALQADQERLDARAMELDDRRDELSKREHELDARQHELDQREAGLAAREKAVAKAESATKKSGG